MINGDDREKTKIIRFSNPKERKKNTNMGEPALNIPPVIKILCLVNIVIFLFWKIFPNLLTEEILYSLAFVPARYFGDQSSGFLEFFSPLTHMFIHGGWTHLAINIGTLTAFGAGLEKKIGGRKLLILYFVTGFCGILMHLIVYPTTDIPLIGASGAVSGLFGSILILMQSEGLIGQGLRKLLFFISLWIGVSIFFGFFGIPGTNNPIAWTAHIGGFIGGLLLYKPICRL